MTIASQPRGGPSLPTLLHLCTFEFGRRHHPGAWRTTVGLDPYFRNIVLSGTNPGYFPQDDDPGDTRANAVEVLRHQEFKALSEPSLAASTARLLTQRYGRIDAIVGHFSSAVRGLHLARLWSVPLMAIFHGDDANLELHGRKYAADYARLRAAPAAFYVAVSQNLVDRLLEYQMAPERTLLCHLGIDLDCYAVPARAETQRPVRIVMAGRFRPAKGHELAIRAFAEFVRHFPGASLDFIGSTDKPEHHRREQDLQAFVARLGLTASIRFRGEMAVEALAEEFANADICLQTSVFIPEVGQVEGVPNTILEAMATGLPVVATRHGGIREAVIHERTGLLVEEDDVAGLSQALGRLAADPALRRRYGLAGRERIEAEFNLVRQSERLAEYIRRMIAAYGALTDRAREAAWNA